MTADLPEQALELRSLVTSQGTLELSLHDVPVPCPAANEVLVRVEAAPINPSDLGLLIAGADMSTATVAGTPERPVVTAALGEGALAGLSARVDQSLPVGNEGAGTVVAAGSSQRPRPFSERWWGSPEARCTRSTARWMPPPVSSCRTGRRRGTGRRPSSIRLTALGMLETMRREGHSALVHTAAASNLGQMLVKLCSGTGCRSSTSSASPTRKNC